MLFANRIRQIREEKGLLQRHVSSAIDMDNAMFCKIERGDRLAKREQVSAIAKFLLIDENDLLKLWLADKIIRLIENETQIVDDALNIAKEDINKRK